MDGRLTALVFALHLMVGIAIVASALAIEFARVPGWWRPLAIIGSVLGVGAFAVFWDGRTELLFKEGVVG